MGNFSEVIEVLGKVFAEQDNYNSLIEKAREKQNKTDIARNVQRLMNDYVNDFESMRILFSFMIGMKEDEIKVLYLGQGASSQREKAASEEGFEEMVNELIEDGWLLRNENGEIEIDYDFLDCLDEVDKGVI